jgi:hypothetical protein
VNGHGREWHGLNTSVVVRNTLLLQNSAGSGGGASITSAGAVVLQGSNFSQNNATDRGGGAAIGGTASLIIDSSSFFGNAAFGGAQLDFASGANITFTGDSNVTMSAGATQIVASLAGSVSGLPLPGFEFESCLGESGAGVSLLCESSTISAPGTRCSFPEQVGGWTIPPPGMILDANGHPVESSGSQCPCYFSMYWGEGRSKKPAQPTVVVSTLQIGCAACAQGRFKLDAASNTCRDCTYGGNCSTGLIYAGREFWGSARDFVPSFYRCPPQYCNGVQPGPLKCDRDGKCAAADACAGNRAGLLCGTCKNGTSQLVGSAGCRDSTRCSDAVWFVPLVLLLALLYAVYALHARAKVAVLPVWPFNSVHSAVYFYQLGSLLPVGSSASSVLLAALTGLVNMQLVASSGDGGACPFPGLTTRGAIALHYAVPLVVSTILALGYWYEARVPRSDPAVQKRGGCMCYRWRRPSLAQYRVAGVRAFTLAYSTALSTTFELLDSVTLNDGSRRLSRSATVHCGAWQLPLYALAVVLVLPVVLGLLPAFSSRWGVVTSGPAAQTLSAPFKEGCAYWEAVLALHRLCAVTAHSFIVNSATLALLQVLVSMTALACHLLCQPFRAASANRTQTALLSLLVVVALINVPQAVLDTNAQSASTTMLAHIAHLRDAGAVLLFAPACVLGTALVVRIWQQRQQVALAFAATGTALSMSGFSSGSVEEGAAGCVSFACALCSGCRQARAEEPLGEPLVAYDCGGEEGADGRDAAVIENSRGLRLTFRTPDLDGAIVDQGYAARGIPAAGRQSTE